MCATAAEAGATFHSAARPAGPARAIWAAAAVQRRYIELVPTLSRLTPMSSQAMPTRLVITTMDLTPIRPASASASALVAAAGATAGTTADGATTAGVINSGKSEKAARETARLYLSLADFSRTRA